MTDFTAARDMMVNCQIRTNKVTDEAVVSAMREVPRERFVPHDLQGVAYLDEDLPLGDDRYLIEPMVFARMLQAVAITPGDVVLDIGSATGYSAAVIAGLASTVIAIETDRAAVASANAVLTELNIDNVAIFEQALTLGYPAQAPYDVILFEGSVGRVPREIEEQLAEGGRMCAVIANGTGPGHAVLTHRLDGRLTHRNLFDANIAPLPGFARAPSFVF